MKPGFQIPPLANPNEKQHREQIAGAVQNAMAGKINATSQVTLTASATSTTLTDKRIGANTVILFEPTTADAATAAANLYVDTTTQKNGSVTLRHASSANVDQTFRVLFIG